ncbi:hypothetical protein GMPD_14030 [Geomonas paludis]|uniref:Uncharacterized protein n=1 Tax=Geomonas paludis TaxID=2740185 RepID=A0A6V8MUC4_9BACT|nr:hypothetical protein GMPD_14030 [Geomonas paludis]
MLSYLVLQSEIFVADPEKGTPDFPCDNAGISKKYAPGSNPARGVPILLP